jgi:hypothetical protein
VSLTTPDSNCQVGKCQKCVGQLFARWDFEKFDMNWVGLAGGCEFFGQKLFNLKCNFVFISTKSLLSRPITFPE